MAQHTSCPNASEPRDGPGEHAVKVVDANVLLYAVNQDSPRHEAARTWLDESLSGTEAVGFAWVVLLAFLRLSTRQDLFQHPLSAAQAFDLVRAWLAGPPAVDARPVVRPLAALW